MIFFELFDTIYNNAVGHTNDIQNRNYELAAVLMYCTMKKLKDSEEHCCGIYDINFPAIDGYVDDEQIQVKRGDFDPGLLQNIQDEKITVICDDVQPETDDFRFITAFSIVRYVNSEYYRRKKKDSEIFSEALFLLKEIARNHSYETLEELQFAYLN